MRVGITICLVWAALSARAETLDRIAVTVGKQVIPESQILLDLRAASLVLQKPVDLSTEAKRKAAGWRVDQLLMLQEAGDSHLTLPSEEDVKGQVDALKARYATPSLYQADLDRHQITESDLASFFLADLREQAFMDLRFGPEIQITDEDLRARYDAQPPSARASSFEDQRSALESVITKERVEEALEKWLVTARAGARIQYRDKVFP